MTDPRMTRLLAIAQEVRAIAADLGTSVHVTGSVWPVLGTLHNSADMAFFDALPPGMSALDFEWSEINPENIPGKATVDGVSLVVYLNGAQRHLVADLLPKAAEVSGV